MQEDNLHRISQNSHDAKNDSGGQGRATDDLKAAVEPEYNGVDFLSIAELARRLGLPESSTRFYCKRFAAYLPHLGAGRRRRYSPQVLDILRRILFLMAKNKDARGVEKELPAYFPRVHGGVSGSMDGDFDNNRNKSGRVNCCASTGLDSGIFDFDKIMLLLERQALALEGMASGLNELCGMARSGLLQLFAGAGIKEAGPGDAGGAACSAAAAAQTVAGQTAPEALAPSRHASVPAQTVPGASERLQSAAVSGPEGVANPLQEVQELRSELHSELARLKRFVSSLETTQQEDLQQLRDWLGRLAQELRQKNIS